MVHDDFLWLLSKESAPLLQTTQDQLLQKVNILKIAKSLRTQTTPARSAMVLEQAQLRIRGRAKFTKADQMFFTRRGLEQSTSEAIAHYKATRYDHLKRVADLCCGIGGDLVGLLHRTGATRTVGVDSDELTHLFGKHNAQLVGESFPHQETTVVQETFADFDLKPFDGIHCDPDRRIQTRTVHGNRFSPTLHDVLDRASQVNALGIKVAPATPPDKRYPDQIEREWIGNRRECKQQMLWIGPIARHPGNRTATLVDSDRTIHSLTIAEREVALPCPAHLAVDRYIFEPHPTVLAAGLNHALANRYGLGLLTPGIAYLTGDRPIDNPLLSQFETVATLPLNLRETAHFLKQHHVGTIEVKKRGVSKVAFDQFERLKLEGPNRATLILTRLGDKQMVIVARRNPNDFD